MGGLIYVIKVERIDKPRELTDDVQKQLTDEFKKDKKKQVWNKSYIRKELLKECHGKCVYCESLIGEGHKEMHIDHFHYKDKYKDEVVSWENLNPSCPHCNKSKSSHDTYAEPIINPFEQNPQDYFCIKHYRYYSKNSEVEEIARRTIGVLELNDTENVVMLRFKVGEALIQEIQDICEFAIENKDILCSKTVKRNRVLRGCTAGYNSVLSSRADISKDCYLEVSYVHGEAKVGEHCVLSYIDIHDEVIPDNVVMHGLKQRDGKFIVRIFGVNDNPKENRLFGMDLEQIEKDLDVKLWPDDSHTLWSAALYPEADTIEEAVSAALNLYAIVHGEEQADLSAWKAAPKKSLCSGFNDADPDAIIAWNRRMADLVAMDEIAKAIRNKVPAAKLRKMKSLTKIQKEWLERRIKKADFSEKMRLHYYLGVILDDEDEVQECFRTIQSEVLASTIKNLSYNENARIVTEKHTVKLPLRVNWGGGWSDTPPYCNENGGTVLNVAILLNGQKPVEVTLEKISEKKIVFDSRDMDVHGEFDTIEPLQATGDPFDPFALQKACLLACGIIPKEGSSLEEILDRLGGGFEMHSEVTNVPKGSGLGTSSILSAACVKAVFEFMGIAYTEEDLYAHVLAMEQIMSTGGGWQDQVGGITPGLKYITSMPGIDQKLKVTHVEIPEAAKQELSDRFVLIYTGQRRLARNLLRDVVGRYVGNEPESLFALEEIQKTAALMRFELERGNVDGFASLLDYHWELSKKVDAGSSNTLIEQIFSSIEELIDGKLVCGAGGGGFLQVILKKGVTRQQVEERLNEVFMDSLVGVADCRLVWE